MNGRKKSRRHICNIAKPLLYFWPIQITFGQSFVKRIRIQDVAEALPIALLLFLLGKRSGGVDFGETRKTFDQSDFVKRGAFARKPKPQGENQYHAGGHAG